MPSTIASSVALDIAALADHSTCAAYKWKDRGVAPRGYIRGMAVSGSVLYVTLSQASTSTVDTLARIDMTTGVYTVIGPTGRTDIQGLAISPTGVLYAAGISGGLYTLDSSTGAATVIGGTFSGDDQALEFDVEARGSGRPGARIGARRHAQLAERAHLGRESRTHMQCELTFLKPGARPEQCLGAKSARGPMQVRGSEVEIAEPGYLEQGIGGALCIGQRRPIVVVRGLHGVGSAWLLGKTQAWRKR